MNSFMDWTKVILEKSPKSARPKMGELSKLDYAKIKVISRLIKKSIAAIIQTAVLTYLSRNWEEHEKRLIVEANATGKTPEELFVELAEGQSAEDVEG